jgi:hypothetical protein
MNPMTRRPRPQTESSRDVPGSAYNAGMPTPSTNGRTPRGQFAKGNLGGPGNPYAKRVAWLRQALLDAVSADDIRAIVMILVARAKDGDMAAIRELLDRLIGKASPPQDDSIELEPLQSLSDDQLEAVARTILGNRICGSADAD